jgi:hypothetical protein
VRTRTGRPDDLVEPLIRGVAQARCTHAGPGGWGSPLVPATAVLDWNGTAVATVRAALPAKAQLEADLYVAYVQASVYDAVVKIAGCYEPYRKLGLTSRAELPGALAERDAAPGRRASRSR